jgi:hypothetical protein
LSNLPPACRRGEHQFDHWRFFFGVQSERDATAIIFHTDGAVGMQRDLDFFAKPGQRFVSRVVQHFLDDVQRVICARVHARPLLDGLQALEHADGLF